MVETVKATERDIAEISAIYERIHDEEESRKTSIGWVRGVYPTEKTAREALAAGELFVMKDDGRTVAAARINKNQVAEYANANWHEKNAPSDKIMVLHTLVVDPLCKGKGYGTAFVDFYEKFALENGCPYLRMDTNAVNTAARRLYSRLGYTEADIVPCDFNGIRGISLVCLEKTLSAE